MWTLKSKARPTIAFFVAINQLFGGPNLWLLPSTVSLSELCTTIDLITALGSSRKLGGAAVHLIAKKRICRFELWILESACYWKAQYHKIIQIISRKPTIMLAVLFGIKCKKKILAKPNNAKKSASTICKSLLINRKDDKNYKKMYCCSLLHYRLKSIFIRSYVIRIVIKHWDCIVSYSSCASSFPRKLFHCEWHTNWDFSHDVTKIWTRKLLILLLFYFHDV